MMLTLRLTAPNDYSVHEDGQLIGRINRCLGDTRAGCSGPRLLVLRRHRA